MNYNTGELDCADTAVGGPALPCLNSGISIETPTQTPLQALSTQGKRTVYLLTESIDNLAKKYSINRLGFLTLTFAEHITDPAQAQQRLNSLVSNVIKRRYLDYIGCMERQKSGRIHYHLLVVLDHDIRSGVNFYDLAKKDYSSAPPSLRAEWAYWRKTAKKYRFGRTELLPVRSNIQAMAKYVGKYISKHMDARQFEDKGVRLVRYSKGARIGNTRFQFHSTGSVEWRRKVAIFAGLVQASNPGETVESISDISRLCGKRWAYNHRELIANLGGSPLVKGDKTDCVPVATQ